MKQVFDAISKKEFFQLISKALVFLLAKCACINNNNYSLNSIEQNKSNTEIIIDGM